MSVEDESAAQERPTGTIGWCVAVRERASWRTGTGLLGHVLDGLDALYDQRYGAPVGRVRDTRAEIWLVRLLLSTAVALQRYE